MFLFSAPTTTTIFPRILIQPLLSAGQQVACWMDSCADNVFGMRCRPEELCVCVGAGWASMGVKHLFQRYERIMVICRNSTPAYLLCCYVFTVPPLTQFGTQKYSLLRRDIIARLRRMGTRLSGILGEFQPSFPFTRCFSFSSPPPPTHTEPWGPTYCVHNAHLGRGGECMVFICRCRCYLLLYVQVTPAGPPCLLFFAFVMFTPVLS